MSEKYTIRYYKDGDSYWKSETINPAFETYDDFGTYWSRLTEEDGKKGWRAVSCGPGYEWMLQNITNDEDEIFLMYL